MIYDQHQRELFKNGELIKQWAIQYPFIFDEQDKNIAEHQAQAGYHFFEWLAAIVIYESLGLLSLIEQYEFAVHQRKQKVLNQILPTKVQLIIRDHKADFGNIQCPDLLVYAPDYSNWFFCEVKGPNDQLGQKQDKFFEALINVGERPIWMIKFKPFSECK
jgi:hypothetical protein